MRVVNLNLKTIIRVNFQQLNISTHKTLYTQINIATAANTSGKLITRENLNETYKKIMNLA